MKNFWNAGLFAVAVASAAPAAFAADIADIEPIYNWTGFYVGGGIGVAFADFDVDTKSCDDINLTGNCNNEGPEAPKGDGSFELYNTDFSDTGILGTVQAGFDFQLGDSIVVGIMGDATWPDIDDDKFHHVEYLQEFTDTAGQEWKAEIDAMYTIAGRLGFLIQPEMLVYALGGWTWADMKTHYFEGCGGDGGCDDINASEKDTVDGFTVGGGFEMMFASHWTGRLEYRFTDLDDVELFGQTDPYSAETKTDTEVHQIRATINFKFN
jgi:outer membrane immunogenic protein